MSDRGYLSQAELAQYADITIDDAAEADDQITMAEELIDQYVGPQNKFMKNELRGLLSAGGNNNVTLEQTHQNNMQKNYLRGCTFEVMGGTGEGQRVKITGQTYEGVITFETNLTTPLDATSYYRIYQLGKFPRQQDTSYDSQHQPNQYYKSIPDKIRRAVAAQVEFIVNKGVDFFTDTGSNFTSEHIGDYSYTKAEGANVSSGNIGSLIAPKAKVLLRGITNRTGVII